MRINSLPIGIIILLTACTVQAQNDVRVNEDLFVQDQLKLIASNFTFTEGSSSDKDGNVFFTDQPADKIWKYSTDGQLSVFLEKSGRSNGTDFDNKGNLITCADEKGELWSLDRKGNIKVLVKDLDGKQLNGPNDIWVDLKGGIYLTDPYYHRSYWTRSSPDLSTESVYYLPKGSQVMSLAADDLQKPNGIVGTPDGKYLYVSDIKAGKTYQYTIGKKGQLTEKKFLIDQGSDGMTLDEKGNLYLTGDGVSVYNPQGVKINQIQVPHGTTNVCFSGKDKNVLFITARKAIYILPMKVKGVE